MSTRCSRPASAIRIGSPSAGSPTCANSTASPIRSRPDIPGSEASTAGLRAPKALPVLLAHSPGEDERKSNRLACVRHRRSEAAIDRKCLTVDVGRFVARQEQSHRRNLLGLARALQRIELTDLVMRSAILRTVED